MFGELLLIFYNFYLASFVLILFLYNFVPSIVFYRKY